MIKTKLTLVLTFVFCFFCFTNLYAATEISNIEVNFPKPVIGQQMCTINDVVVNVNGNTTFDLMELKWFKYNYETSVFDEVVNQNEKFVDGYEYRVKIQYKRPHEYNVTNSTVNIKVNDDVIDATNEEVFINGAMGDTNFSYDTIMYSAGYPDYLKTLDTLSITVPKSIIGKEMISMDKVIVKADNDITFDMMELKWYKYNESTSAYEEVTDVNEKYQMGVKYRVRVQYKRPHEYFLDETTIALKVNDNLLDATDFENYQCGMGDENYSYDVVYYDMGQPDYIASLYKIDISIPTPLIGEKVISKEEVEVLGNTEFDFDVIELKWYKYNESTSLYEEVTDLNEKFVEGVKYRAIIRFKRSHAYKSEKDNLEIYINNNQIDMANYDNTGMADVDYQYDRITYDFGMPLAKKIITKVEVTLPTVDFTKMPPELSSVVVKANGEENLEILELTWLIFDKDINGFKKWENTDEGFKEGEKYAIGVRYKRPIGYVIDFDTFKLLINGKEVDISDNNLFNFGLMGDDTGLYDVLTYSAENLQENSDETDLDNNISEGEKQEQPLDNPKTGDDIIIYFAAFAVAAAGLTIFYTKLIKNKKVEMK